MRRFATGFHEEYREYALRTPAAWLEAVDGRAVRQVCASHIRPKCRSQNAALLVLGSGVRRTVLSVHTLSAPHVLDECVPSLNMSKAWAALSGCYLTVWVVAQVLDKAFMSCVLLLSTFWEASAMSNEQPPPPTSPLRAAAPAAAAVAEEPVLDQRDALAVLAMDALSALQFCRMRLSSYSLLLQDVLTALVRSPQARPDTLYQYQVQRGCWSACHRHLSLFPIGARKLCSSTAG